MHKQSIRRVIFYSLLSVFASVTLAQEAEKPVEVDRSIAITFDDATKGDGPFFTGAERTQRLIDSLSRAGVSEALFFVTTRNVERQGESGHKRIVAYTDAGHMLGNHSHSHLWLNRTPTAEYIADLDLAIDRLQPYANLTSLYRFPFLDEGRSPEKRNALRRALSARSLSNGYVTIDTYDWYIDRLAKEAVDADIEIDREDLRDLYVDVIVSSTEFYDEMAQKVLNRSPRHVLLLHENDMSALFIGDLVTELRERGFQIIPANDAYEDPIAGLEPDTLFLGQGRIAALAHESGLPPSELVSPTEDEGYLRRRFESEVSEIPQ
ncbi:MAG: polysaccharide deacetylase family protein [Gammaproteobacteria bacterium]|nr:polysaccharide deacetylase family protein [Gammaproteobacteria bacterium]